MDYFSTAEQKYLQTEMPFIYLFHILYLSYLKTFIIQYTVSVDYLFMKKYDDVRLFYRCMYTIPYLFIIDFIYYFTFLHTTVTYNYFTTLFTLNLNLSFSKR